MWTVRGRSWRLTRGTSRLRSRWGRSGVRGGRNWPISMPICGRRSDVCACICMWQLIVCCEMEMCGLIKWGNYARIINADCKDIHTLNYEFFILINSRCLIFQLFIFLFNLLLSHIPLRISDILQKRTRLDLQTDILIQFLFILEQHTTHKPYIPQQLPTAFTAISSKAFYFNLPITIMNSSFAIML